MTGDSDLTTLRADVECVTDYLRHYSSQACLDGDPKCWRCGVQAAFGRLVVLLEARNEQKDEEAGSGTAASSGGGVDDLRLVGFWNAVIDVDDWLDSAVDGRYVSEPMAQDWARVAKIAEEAGEAIAELILVTGQNPRKGIDPDARERMLDELADAALTGVLAIQHFTKDSTATRERVTRRMSRTWNRMVTSTSSGSAASPNASESPRLAAQNEDEPGAHSIEIKDVCFSAPPGVPPNVTTSFCVFASHHEGPCSWDIVRPPVPARDEDEPREPEAGNERSAFVSDGNGGEQL